MNDFWRLLPPSVLQVHSKPLYTSRTLVHVPRQPLLKYVTAVFGVRDEVRIVGGSIFCRSLAVWPWQGLANCSKPRDPGWRRLQDSGRSKRKERPFAGGA